MSRAIDKVPHCTDMTEVRQGVNALDDILVPLLVQRSGFMTQAARVKNDDRLVRLFDYDVDSPYSYWFVCRPRALRQPAVKLFHDWLLAAKV